MTMPSLNTTPLAEFIVEVSIVLKCLERENQ